MCTRTKQLLTSKDSTPLYWRPTSLSLVKYFNRVPATTGIYTHNVITGQSAVVSDCQCGVRAY
jgi:hypothetical protein